MLSCRETHFKRYVKGHYAKLRCAERHYSECRDTYKTEVLTKFVKSSIFHALEANLFELV
jgi:hypothetical protein